MKLPHTLTLCLAVLLSCQCSSNSKLAHNWEVEVRPIMGDRPVVPDYEVEFLPMLPADPRAFTVGKFYIHGNAALDFGDEEMVKEIKQRAASMGGNTVIYPDTGVTEAMVAYVPQESVNLHGGDDEQLDGLSGFQSVEGE